MKKYLFYTLLVMVTTVFAELRERPQNWATAVIGSSLDNLYKVDDGIYRSEQPGEKEFEILSQFGIKEILNLREYHSDNDEAEGLNLLLHRVKLSSFSVTEAQLIVALRKIQQRKGPILVHCWHGSDRTGAVIAAYRIIFNNWTKAQAIDEFRNGGYGYHAIFFPNILELLENLNIKRVKRQLGLK